MRKHYTSEPLPYTLTLENYKQGGRNDYLMFNESNIKNIDLRQYLDLLKKGHKALIHPQYPTTNMVPSKDLILPVDVEKVKSLGIVPEGMDSLIVPYMLLRVKGNGLEKKDLAMLDVLATANWERPLYVNNTSLAQFNIDLSPYIVQEGNAYRILPVFNSNPQIELVNTEVSFENMTKKFKFRGLDDPRGYYNQDYRNFVLNHRSSFNALAEALITENKTEKARETILFSLNKMPDITVPYDYTTSRSVSILFEVGEQEKAIEIAQIVGDRAVDMVEYLIAKGDIDQTFQMNMAIVGELQRTLYEYGEAELAKKYDDAYTRFYEQLAGTRNPGRLEY
jgi:hypothetical protein